MAPEGGTWRRGLADSCGVSGGDATDDEDDVALSSQRAAKNQGAVFRHERRFSTSIWQKLRILQDLAYFTNYSFYAYFTYISTYSKFYKCFANCSCSTCLQLTARLDFETPGLARLLHGRCPGLPQYLFARGCIIVFILCILCIFWTEIYTIYKMDLA